VAGGAVERPVHRATEALAVHEERDGAAAALGGRGLVAVTGETGIVGVVRGFGLRPCGSGEKHGEKHRQQERCGARSESG